MALSSKCQRILTSTFKKQLFTSAAVFSNFKFSRELQSNEFWRKKFQRALAVRDTDGDGFITRSDFKLIIQRYKDMGSSEEHLKKLNSTFMKSCDMWGLTDDSVALTYDKFAKNVAMEFAVENTVKVFQAMFEIIDMNNDGVIAFEEWEKYNKAIGISPSHAQRSFTAMDADGDGKVTKDDFIAYNLEFFFSTKDDLNSSILFGPLEN